MLRRTRGQEPWVPQDRKERPAGGHGEGGEGTADGSLASLFGRTALGAAAILGAGYAIARPDPPEGGLSA